MGKFVFCFTLIGIFYEIYFDELSGASILNNKEDNMRTLRDVKPGETVTVVKLTGEGAIKRRIMDMGITKNTPVYVRKVAPLGDPVEVTVRGYELSLRKADAEMVSVE
jgi:ferrous iron transport protein A